jgi:hypothetical protein
MVAFPSKWRKEAVLLAGVPALDPSIVQFDNRWWLFYAVQRDDTIELHVSYADSVYGPWLPHAKQPVKSDSASCRPAGTPFIHEGRLYRPAQDCSRYYGERVIINEVDLLSPLEFEEKVVSVVEPDRNGPCPDGLHTLSAMGNTTLIDGKREKFVMVAAVKNVQKLLKDILLRFRGQRFYRKAMQNIEHHNIVFCIANWFMATCLDAICL